MLPGERIGRFVVRGVLGRGAAGVVVRALDPASGREVAIKVLAPLVGARNARFETEVAALRRLEHPHIVRVHEAGVHHGRPFLVVDLVAGGRTLEHRLEAEGPLPPAEAAALARSLALAVHHVHGRGVLHRDLKPANVLLTPDGVPLLTDFGLAKDLLDEGAGPSQTGQSLGTPGYWAPEQAVGDRRRLGPATDVYGLGALLYALLTGRPPFVGESFVQVLTRTVDDAPVPPSRLRPVVPRALERICLRCLAKDPARRYPSAQALARDLDRFLLGPPVAERPRRPAAWAVGAA
ncbi:MAG: serine/threonine protein kinase, partial [Planctomycetes bacterium]|nr:serine/threonine protein kinase [Planctomycetota bacterium]